MRKLIVSAALAIGIASLSPTLTLADTFAGYANGQFSFVSSTGMLTGTSDSTTNFSYYTVPGDTTTEVTLYNVDMSFTAHTTGPATGFTDSYGFPEFAQDVQVTSWTFSQGNVNLLTITGSGTLSGFDPTTNVSLTGPTITLNDVAYSSSFLSVPPSSGNTYESSLSITTQQEVSYDPTTHKISSFNGTGIGTFDTAPVPEASTLLGFGLLTGGGLLGLRRLRTQQKGPKN